MASSAQVAQEFRRFVESPEPETLCVKGAWGVGKTFLWQQAFGESVKLQRFALKRSSYVSLFGMNSLADLKRSIYENWCEINFGTGVLESKIDQIANSISQFARKNKNALELIPKIGPIIEKSDTLLFSTVSKALICLDDLERRSSGLKISEILGLVSFLREQRECKVVLLMNEEKLDEDDQACFLTFLEKVVDADLTLSPEASEAAIIGIPGMDDFSVQVRGLCVSLNLTNIRIIKKIRKVAQEAVSGLGGISKPTWERILTATVLLCWIRFDPTKAPTREFVEQRKGRYSSIVEGASEDEQKWKDLLDSYGFFFFSSLDAALCDGVFSGVFDRDKLRDSAQEFQANDEADRRSASFKEAYDAFWDNLDNNEDELVANLRSSFERNAMNISLNYLDISADLLRTMGREELANEIIDLYVQRRNEPRAFWDLAHAHRAARVSDPGVRTAFASKLASMPLVRDPGAILAKTGDGFGYDDDDLAFIGQLPVHEIVSMLKSLRGQKFHSVMHAVHSLSTIINPTPAMTLMLERMVQALRAISSESRLNAIRIRAFGVRGLELPASGDPGEV